MSVAGLWAAGVLLLASAGLALFLWLCMYLGTHALQAVWRGLARISAQQDARISAMRQLNAEHSETPKPSPDVSGERG